MDHNGTIKRQCQCYGTLGYTNICGLCHLNNGNLSYLSMNVATYTRDAMYQSDIGISALREWLSFGSLWLGVALCGVSCLHGLTLLGDASWAVAT